MIRPTFSALPLAVACPATMVLPRVRELEADDEEAPDTWTPAERGTVIHRFAERVSELHRRDPELSLDERIEQALAEAPEGLRPTLRSIDLASIPTDLSAEVALAWDWQWRRGRLLGVGLGRNYPELGPTEIAGTTDLLGHRPGEVYVGDIKTGHTRYPRPGKFFQTLAAGLAATDIFRAERAVLELLYVDESGLVWPVRDVIDAWDLEDAATSIASAMRAAASYEAEYQAGRGVPLVTGSHCRYCPSLTLCPGQTALLRSLPAELGGLADGPITNDRAAEIYRQVQLAKGLLGRVEAELHTLAAVRPIDLGEGLVLGEVSWQREELDGPVALRQLAKLVGEEAARGAAKVSLSKEAARETIAAHAKRGERVTTKARTGLFDRYLEELRAQRAIKLRSGRSVKIHRRKEGAS